MNVSSPRCADGFMGQRCEFKDLDGTYLCKYATLKVCHHISVSRSKIDVIIVFFLASSEKLRMAASQTVGSGSSTVILGVMIIVVGTIAAAAVFTSKRTRAKMRQIEQIRSVNTFNQHQLTILSQALSICYYQSCTQGKWRRC